MGIENYINRDSNNRIYTSNTPTIDMTGEELILSNLNSMSAERGNIYHDPEFRANAVRRLAKYVIETNTNPNKYKGKHFYAELLVALAKEKATAAPAVKVEAPANDDPSMGND